MKQMVQNELPFIPMGPFKLRLPGVHYKVEKVEFIQGVIIGVTALTLLFQAFVCARIGMEYCKTNLDRSIAGIMAAVLATKGSAWALLIGIFLNLLLSNFKRPLELNEENQG